MMKNHCTSISILITGFTGLLGVPSGALLLVSSSRLNTDEYQAQNFWIRVPLAENRPICCM